MHIYTTKPLKFIGDIMLSKKDQNHRKGPRPDGAEKMMKTFKEICKKFEKPPPKDLLEAFKKGLRNKIR